jgi:DNA-binding PadR family transcriptional regulator
MQEPTFLVLTALAGPPLHGYAIMQAIDELVGGASVVRPGTLYAALDRLTADALIEVAYTDEWADGRVRRYYRLTPRGADALREEAQRRHRLADIALRRLSTNRGAGFAPSPA